MCDIIIDPIITVAAAKSAVDRQQPGPLWWPPKRPQPIRLYFNFLPDGHLTTISFPLGVIGSGQFFKMQSTFSSSSIV